MAAIRTAVRTLWHTEQLRGWPTSQPLVLARHWIGQPFSEDKLAGTLLLAEQLAGRLTLDDGDALARPLAEGKLADGDALARPVAEGSWPTGAAATGMPPRPCTPTSPQPSA
jgi:hypothetical protein